MKLQYDEPLSSFAFNFNLRRYKQEDLNEEMENQHRRQHAARHESGAARLLLWRDPARTALLFAAGGLVLAAARAPDLVAQHVPVNPVVVAAYASMAGASNRPIQSSHFPTWAVLSVKPLAIVPFKVLKLSWKWDDWNTIAGSSTDTTAQVELKWDDWKPLLHGVPVPRLRHGHGRVLTVSKPVLIAPMVSEFEARI